MVRRAHETIINLVEIINDKIRDRTDACAISFDFTSAFDTVDHGLIMAVMKMFGFPEKMLHILKLILNGRCARVVNDAGILSKPFSIGRGVPQGDVHSPLTFIIATAPLFEELLSSGLALANG